MAARQAKSACGEPWRSAVQCIINTLHYIYMKVSSPMHHQYIALYLYEGQQSNASSIHCIIFIWRSAVQCIINTLHYIYMKVSSPMHHQYIAIWRSAVQCIINTLHYILYEGQQSNASSIHCIIFYNMLLILWHLIQNSKKYSAFVCYWLNIPRITSH